MMPRIGASRAQVSGSSASGLTIVSRRIVAFAVLAIIAFVPQYVVAATDTWQGNASPNWADLNWTGGNNPPVAGDALLFGAAGSSGTTLNNNLAADFNVAGITYNAGASAFTFNGNQITLAGGITNNSTSLQTINLPMI